MPNREGSSMVVEFTRPEDLKQACYEATLDLTLYIYHLRGIADRCEKNFPEVAAGLRGTVAGMAQYLRGVDGEWKTVMLEDLKKIVAQENFLDHQWAYEFARDPRCCQMLFGCMAAIASQKPGLDFWETLQLARHKISDFEPLIEQLLASSPMRKPQ